MYGPSNGISSLLWSTLAVTGCSAGAGSAGAPPVGSAGTSGGGSTGSVGSADCSKSTFDNTSVPFSLSLSSI